eukprot:GHVN01073993.1.p1 GENE.GHVN01073993.1~~GHVN01073993.1.p1  ORF type:complete len:606 (+),score=151.13 GHVN01073993.1:227-1819(+)
MRSALSSDSSSPSQRLAHGVLPVGESFESPQANLFNKRFIRRGDATDSRFPYPSLPLTDNRHDRQDVSPDRRYWPTTLDRPTPPPGSPESETRERWESLLISIGPDPFIRQANSTDMRSTGYKQGPQTDVLSPPNPSYARWSAITTRDSLKRQRESSEVADQVYDPRSRIDVGIGTPTYEVALNALERLSINLGPKNTNSKTYEVETQHQREGQRSLGISRAHFQVIKKYLQEMNDHQHRLIKSQSRQGVKHSSPCKIESTHFVLSVLDVIERAFRSGEQPDDKVIKEVNRALETEINYNLEAWGFQQLTDLFSYCRGVGFGNRAFKLILPHLLAAVSVNETTHEEGRRQLDQLSEVDRVKVLGGGWGGNGAAVSETKAMRRAGMDETHPFAALAKRAKTRHEPGLPEWVPRGTRQTKGHQETSHTPHTYQSSVLPVQPSVQWYKNINLEMVDNPTQCMTIIESLTRSDFWNSPIQTALLSSIEKALVRGDDMFSSEALAKCLLHTAEAEVIHIPFMKAALSKLSRDVGQ